MLGFFWIFVMTLSLSITASLAQSRPAGEFQIEPQCDLADVNLNSQKAKSKEECAAGCQKSPQCRAFVFVSGWNRCFLKSSSKKKAKIRFYSSDVKKEGETAVVAAGGGYDQDHSGKDLERKVLSSPKACEEACVARKDCRAFTFIEGYDVCWLKKDGGRLLPKIFYCGIPKS